MKIRIAYVFVLALLFAAAVFACLDGLGICFGALMNDDLSLVEQIIEKGVWVLGSALLLFGAGYWHYSSKKISVKQAGSRVDF